MSRDSLLKRNYFTNKIKINISNGKFNPKQNPYTAGATPKEIMSARESKSCPRGDLPYLRATLLFHIHYIHYSKEYTRPRNHIKEKDMKTRLQNVEMSLDAIEWKEYKKI